MTIRKETGPLVLPSMPIRPSAQEQSEHTSYGVATKETTYHRIKYPDSQYSKLQLGHRHIRMQSEDQTSRESNDQVNKVEESCRSVSAENFGIENFGLESTGPKYEHLKSKPHRVYKELKTRNLRGKVDGR